MKAVYGKNGFFEKYYIPIAILKLKQGFGRLIRTKSDAGFVAIMDGRIRLKYHRYGERILNALPSAKLVGRLDQIDTIK